MTKRRSDEGRQSGDDILGSLSKIIGTVRRRGDLFDRGGVGGQGGGLPPAGRVFDFEPKL